jgi:hypothetical protein
VFEAVVPVGVLEPDLEHGVAGERQPVAAGRQAPKTENVSADENREASPTAMRPPSRGGRGNRLKTARIAYARNLSKGRPCDFEALSPLGVISGHSVAIVMSAFTPQKRKRYEPHAR